MGHSNNTTSTSKYSFQMYYLKRLYYPVLSVPFLQTSISYWIFISIALMILAFALRQLTPSGIHVNFVTFSATPSPSLSSSQATSSPSPSSLSLPVIFRVCANCNFFSISGCTLVVSSNRASVMCISKIHKALEHVYLRHIASTFSFTSWSPPLPDHFTSSNIYSSRNHQPSP